MTVTWDNGTVGYTTIYSSPLTGTFTIMVTATNPCDVVITGTLAVSVTRCKPLTGVAIAGPEVLLVEEVGFYTAVWSPPNASEPITVTWNNGTGGYTTTYSWSAPGWYTITVTAANPCGAEVSGTLAVSVTQCKPLTGLDSVSYTHLTLPTN